jgi:hypothetical protein
MPLEILAFAYGVKKRPGAISRKVNRNCEASVTSEIHLPVIMILHSSNMIIVPIQDVVNINTLSSINRGVADEAVNLRTNDADFSIQMNDLDEN